MWRPPPPQLRHVSTKPFFFDPRSLFLNVGATKRPCGWLLMNLVQCVHIGSLNAYQCSHDYTLHYVCNSSPLRLFFEVVCAPGGLPRCFYFLGRPCSVAKVTRDLKLDPQILIKAQIFAQLNTCTKRLKAVFCYFFHYWSWLKAKVVVSVCLFCSISKISHNQLDEVEQILQKAIAWGASSIE